MTGHNTVSRDPEQLKNILVMREHARADAWLRKDRRALEALLAPDFVEINTFGRFGREELLDRLFPVLTLHQFILENPGIRITGEKTAVLSYRCHERLTMNGRPVEGDFRVFATYTRDEKQYRLSAWEIRPVG
jgi:hypothetical protein